MLSRETVVDVRGLDAVEGYDVVAATAVNCHRLVATSDDVVWTIIRRGERRLHGIVPDEHMRGVGKSPRHVEATRRSARCCGTQSLHRPLQGGRERRRSRRLGRLRGRHQLSGMAQRRAVHQLGRAASDVELHGGADAQ